MKTLSLLTTVCVIAALALNHRAASQTSSKPAPQIISNDGGHTIGYCYFPVPKNIQPEKISEDLRTLQIIPSGSDAIVTSVVSETGGTEHYRMQQTMNGIPVEDGQLIAHYRSGELSSITGNIRSRIVVVNKIVIGAEEALNAALASLGAQKYMWQDAKEEQHLKKMTSDLSATYKPSGVLVLIPVGNSYSYAYRFEVYAQQPLGKWLVWVDAGSGRVLQKTDLLMKHHVTGTAQTRYSGQRSLVTDSMAASQYLLRDLSRGSGITTYNLSNNTAYSAAGHFTDADNYWNAVNGDDIATDVHWAMQKTWDFYLNSFGRNGIDNNGYALINYVHYGTAYCGAYWDGMRAVFGDGSGAMGPLVSVDICAHEYTHGVIQHTANLAYTGESGALNEGFADIFACAVEFFAKPSTANWTIGENIGSVIRNVGNPVLSGNPDTYLGTNWDVNLQVHKNSTVLSHWFYLLSCGGNGTNDKNNNFSVQAIGISKAALIAYRMLTVYLTQYSGFSDARQCAILAATDLYGACSPEVVATTNAMYAVGIGMQYTVASPANASFSATSTTFCQAPAGVGFINSSTSSFSYLWDFGDGSTSMEANPVHHYQSYGVYNVKLIAYGGLCGTDSLSMPAYIDVNPGNLLTIQMPVNNSATAASCCNGIIVHRGDTSGSECSPQGLVSIAPTGAARVQLSLGNLNLSSGQSYVYIYDGNSANDPLLGYYTGTSASAISLMSSGPVVTVRYFASSKVAGDKFDLQWGCIAPSTAPVADFRVIENTACELGVKFSDVSTGGVTSRTWYFGDGTISHDPSPVHTYAVNGIYDVSLKVVNSFGSDSISYPSAVDLSIPQIQNIDEIPACTGSPATLMAYANGEVRWYDHPYASTPISVGDTLVTCPLFFEKTYYAEIAGSTPAVITGKSDPSGATAMEVPGLGGKGLKINVNKKSRLKQLSIYAGLAGNITLALINSQGQMIASQVFAVDSGLNILSPDFLLIPQTHLVLEARGYIPLVYNHHGSVTYPIQGLTMSFTGAVRNGETLNSEWLYFYNIMISPECTSERISVQAHVNQCLGMDNPEGESVRIFPNPAKEALYFTGWVPGKPNQIEIFDLKGSLWFRQETAKGTFPESLDISGLTPGTYIVRINHGGRRQEERIVVSR